MGKHQMPQSAITDINPHKSHDAFRTISEVSHELGVAQHVLRFWETKFAQIRPMKRAGGRRYYRPEDVALLQRIHQLLYAEGYTIPGAQKALKGVNKTGLRAAAANLSVADMMTSEGNVSAQSSAPTTKTIEYRLNTSQKKRLEAALADLIEMKALLSPPEN
ncbi:MAG: MerR family transcriptional regulator [Pseudomonadota bacterium]